MSSCHFDVFMGMWQVHAHIYLCRVWGWRVEADWASSSVTLYTEAGPLSWTQSTLIQLIKLACVPWEPCLHFPGAGLQTDNYMATQDPNSGLCTVWQVFSPVSCWSQISFAHLILGGLIFFSISGVVLFGRVFLFGFFFRTWNVLFHPFTDRRTLREVSPAILMSVR